AYQHLHLSLKRKSTSCSDHLPCSEVRAAGAVTRNRTGEPLTGVTGSVRTVQAGGAGSSAKRAVPARRERNSVIRATIRRLPKHISITKLQIPRLPFSQRMIAACTATRQRARPGRHKRF